MTICYFGTYNPSYPRNRVLMEGLRKNGVTVIESNSRKRGVLKYVSLFFQWLWKGRRVDAVIVGFPMGKGVLPLLKIVNFFKTFAFTFPTPLRRLQLAARLSSVACPDESGTKPSNLRSVFNANAKVFSLLKIGRRIPIIIDGFVSLYDAEVIDRKHFAEGSREAKKLFRWEQEALRFACKVLVDTKANAEYYSKLFSLPLDHFVIIPVGTDERLFYPSADARGWYADERRNISASVGVNSATVSSFRKFIVHFSGTFNPLQGIDVIIRAIRILKNQPLHFRLVGRGEEYERVVKLSQELEVFDRIEFIDRVPYDEYARLMANADICLGIFSDSPKAMRVVPNKVVEAMACGKAIITADTPAIREFLTHGENALLCRPRDPNDLAQKILELYQDEELRVRLGENARTVFLERLTMEKIGKGLLEVIQDITKTKINENIF